MEDYDYLICGSAGVNKFFLVNELPSEGKTVYFADQSFETLHFGGPGLNIAHLLSKLGIHVMPMLCQTAGERYREKLEHLLTDYGAPLCAMTPPDRIEPYYAILIQNPQHQHMTICQPFVGSSAIEQQMDERWFQQIKQAVVCANAPQNIRLFLQYAEANGNDIIFSVKKDETMFPPEVVRRLLKQTTVLFMNREEAEHILALNGKRDVSELFTFERLSEIVVTEGSKGSRIYTRNGEMYNIAVTEAERCIDATGVGDAFVAGYLYGKAKKLSPCACACIASTLSSFIIEEVGDISGAPDEAALLERNQKRRDL